MATHQKQEAIQAEILKLKEIKPRVRPTSIFGDDHRDAIEAQITVLSELMDTRKIYSQYGDEDLDGFAENVLESALEAFYWYTGESDEGTPSEGWTELII